MEDETSDTETRDEMMRCVGVGISLGTAAGILMHNLPMWIAIGVAVGVALGTGLNRRNQASL
ncbi:hypothetical protein U3A55_15050 [Salarchaeum sp. III]|uniref:hypothetical protein n=1 Tax=Salarchaeum sp. III TaxID=3107927 RepID=UPI002ED98336